MSSKFVNTRSVLTNLDDFIRVFKGFQIIVGEAHNNLKSLNDTIAK